MYGPAVWNQSEYKYESLPVPAFGPFHPNPAKSSLLCVTTNGLLKLYFSQSNNRVEETTLELESVTSSSDLLTHASLCSDKSMWFLPFSGSRSNINCYFRYPTDCICNGLQATQGDPCEHTLGKVGAVRQATTTPRGDSLEPDSRG